MSLARGSSRVHCLVCTEIATDRLIQGSVGLNGQNSGRDVKIIQQLLNSVPAIQGGPALFLAEDGICGPKTRAAITKYQNSALGWSDGRIDPSGKTIKALSDLICDSPTVLPGKLGLPASAKQKANTPNTSLPVPGTDGAVAVTIAHSCLRVVEPRLHTLRWRLTRATPPMMALLDKHFATGKQKVTNADVGHVNNVLGRIHHHMARFNAFGKMSFENIILYDADDPDDTIGYTVRGGDKMSTKQFQIYVDKNIPRKYPGNSIWLTKLFGEQPAHEKHLTVLHEFAHFVGPRDGRFGTIDDHAYGFHNHFLTISKFKKLHNAESIALFLLEWAFGTEAIAKMPRIQQFAAHFSAFPHVTSGGEIVMGN